MNAGETGHRPLVMKEGTRRGMRDAKTPSKGLPLKRLETGISGSHRWPPKAVKYKNCSKGLALQNHRPPSTFESCNPHLFPSPSLKRHL